MAMLDLSVYKVKTFDVILLDGTEVGIPTPSQKTVMRLIDANELITKANSGKNKNIKVVLQQLNLLILDILNTNVQRIEFDLNYVVNNFDFNIANAFLDGYMGFVEELNSDPN